MELEEQFTASRDGGRAKEQMGCPESIENQVNPMKFGQNDIAKIWKRHLHAQRSNRYTGHFSLAAKIEINRETLKKVPVHTKVLDETGD